MHAAVAAINDALESDDHEKVLEALQNPKAQIQSVFVVFLPLVFR